jgi:hypothetical protein
MLQYEYCVFARHLLCNMRPDSYNKEPEKQPLLGNSFVNTQQY